MSQLVSEINAGKRFKEKNFGPLANFFRSKTLLHNNKFLAWFDDNVDAPKAELYDNIGYIPRLEYYHFKSVSLPTNYAWNSEPHFMTSFATIGDLIPTEEVAVVLEEDQYGSVAKFINWCQRKLITQAGVMRPKNLYTISALTVDISNLQDRAVSRYKYNNIYFISADTLNVNYDSSDAIQYNITFKCTDIDFMPLVGPGGTIFNTGNPVQTDPSPLRNLPNA